MKNFSAFVLGIVLFVDIGCGIHVSEDLVQKHVMEKGQKISGQITVTNMGLEDELVKLEVCDYSTSHMGKVFFDPPNTLIRSASSWMSLGSSSILLSPGEQKTVPYEFAAPDDDDLLGSYWCIILVAPEAKFKPSEGIGVSTVIRYGIIVLGDMGNDAEASVKILESGVSYKPNERKYWFYILNDGQLMIRPKISLEILDENGNLVFTSPTSPDGFLFPGSSSKTEFDITKAPLGTFTVLVTIDAGEDRVFGAQYETVLKEVPTEVELEENVKEELETYIIDASVRSEDYLENLFENDFLVVSVEKEFSLEFGEFIASEIESIDASLLASMDQKSQISST